MPPTGHRMLRVLMVSWEYPPAVIGGLGRHVEGLASALAAAGHEITVLTRAAPGAPEHEQAGPVRLLRVPAGRPPRSASADALRSWTAELGDTLTAGALGAVGDQAYDIVHGHDWLVAPTASTLAAKLGARLVATVHTTEADRPPDANPPALDGTVHAAEVRLGHDAHRVIVCSRYMRRQVTELLRLPADRVEVVPDGVDAARWNPARGHVTAARLRFLGAGPLIAYAGRLVPEKGVGDLLDALPRLRLRNPGLRLVIAGDGPVRADLRRRARLLRLERAVSFTGFLPQTDLASLIRAADVLVVPSLHEPSGMVALEGAAAGTPLAVANTGGLRELVEPGVTALTFPPGDPDGLAEAVDRLLADRALAYRLADRARAQVLARYTWSSVAARTGRVYADALDGPGTPMEAVQVLSPAR